MIKFKTWCEFWALGSGFLDLGFRVRSRVQGLGLHRACAVVFILLGFCLGTQTVHPKP